VTKLVRPMFVLAGLVMLALGLFAPAGPAAAATTTIAVGDYYFCSSSFDGGNCQTTIHAGDTVVWDFSGATSTHTTTSDTSLWNSGNMNGGTFQFTFSQAGTFTYHCNIHATEMKGTIIVEAAAAPTATLITSGTFPIATLPPTSTPSGGTLPSSGSGPRQPGSTNWWLLGALSIAGAALSGAGLAYARRQL
jgi:hypothetical protein